MSLNNQAARQFEESYGGGDMENETAGGGLSDEDSSIINKFLEQAALNDELRTGRVDLFSVNAPSNYASGTTDFMFTANAQISTASNNGIVEYTALQPEPIDLSSVIVTAELNIKFNGGYVAGGIGLVPQWQYLAAQETIRCGDNFGIVNAQNQNSPDQRQMVAYSRIIAKSTRAAVVQQGQTQGYIYAEPPTARAYPALIHLDDTANQTELGTDANNSRFIVSFSPNCDFFACLKVLPQGTRLKLEYDWGRDSLAACFTLLESMNTNALQLAAIAAISNATITFRIVEVRGSILRLRPDIKEAINNDFNTATDSLALGLTTWGNPDLRNPAVGLKPNLMNPAALASTGRGRPYQFKDYTFHRFNQQAGSTINFGVVPSVGCPRRFFVFPTVAALPSGAKTPPWYWPGKLFTPQTIVGIQVYRNGLPFYPTPLNPNGEQSVLAYTLAQRDLGYYGDRLHGIHIDQREWLLRSQFFVFDLSSTRLESEVEGPDASTVALTITFGNPAGGGAICIGEYDQTGILDDRRNYVNYAVL